MGESNIDTIAEIAEKVSAEIDRRQRQMKTINELLKERQEVLVAMCKLAELETQVSEFDTINENLKLFKQALVDYTALGHFEIYERIIDGKERRGNIKQIADSIYPVISSTTNMFVEFNDKYEGADDSESFDGLYSDLSSIGEAMAERSESEDKLLEEMGAQLNKSASER